MRNEPAMTKLLPSGRILRIYPEEQPDSPRSWDNLGTLLGWHRRYSSPDDTDRELFSILSDYVDRDDPKVVEALGGPDEDGDYEDLEEVAGVNAAIHYANESGKVHILPVFMYDHSGVALSHGRSYPFNCPWDSGFYGIHFIEKEKLFKECHSKEDPEYIKRYQDDPNLTDAEKEKYIREYRENLLTEDNWRKRATAIMEGELETFNQYLSGDVWGFVITDPETGDDVDSCWGFYGTDGINQSMPEHWDKADRPPKGTDIEDLPDADVRVITVARKRKPITPDTFKSEWVCPDCGAVKSLSYQEVAVAAMDTINFPYLGCECGGTLKLKGA